MFPNLAIGIFTSLLPAILSRVAAPAQATGAGVTVPVTSSVTGLIGIIVSAAFATLGAAGFGDAIHNFAALAGSLGVVVGTINHLHLIGGSNANTMVVVENLLAEVAKYKGVPEPVAAPAPVAAQTVASGDAAQPFAATRANWGPSDTVPAS